MANNNNLIEAKGLINDIEAAWTAHYQALKPNVELLQKLSTSYSSIKVPSDYVKTIKDIETGNAKVSDSTEKMRLAEIRLQQQRERAFDKYEQQRAKEDAAILKQLAAEDRAANQRINNSKKVEAQKAKEYAQFEKDFARYEAALEREANTYNKIQAKVNAIIPEYQNLAAKKELGVKLTNTESNRVDFLTGKLTAYQNILKKVDSDMGKHTREVGNYAKANSNLSNSINQISRELPNFGQSFSVGVLSLTNNIGALIDGVKQVKSQNASLASEGKQTTSVLSQVAAGIFNWQTALFVGIGIFSAYSREIGDFVSSLFEAEKALDTLQKRRKGYDETLAKSNVSYQKEIDAYRQLRDIASDSNDPEKQKTAIDKLRNSYGLLLKSKTDDYIATLKGTKAEKEIYDTLKARQDLNRNAENIDELRLKIQVYEKAAQRLNEYEKEKLRLQNIVSSGTTITEGNRGEELSRVVTDEAKNASAALKKLNEQEKERLSLIEDETLRKASLQTINKAIKQDEQDLAKYVSLANKYRNDSILLDGQEEKGLKERFAAIEKLTRALAELREKVMEANSDREIADLERQKFLLETRYNNEKDYADSRIELSQMIADKEISIAADQFLEESRRATDALAEERRQKLLLAKGNSKAISEINLLYDQLTNDKLAIAADTFRTKQEQAEKASQDRIVKIKQDAFQEFLDYRAKYGRPTGDEEKYGQDVNMLPTPQMDDLRNSQADSYKKDLKDKQDYMDKLRLATDEFIKKIRTDFYSSLGLGSLNIFVKDNFNEVTGKWESTLTKLLDGADTAGERFAVIFKAVTDVAKEAFAYINKAQQENFEAQYARLDKEKEVAVAFAGDSAVARANIDREYEERRKQIARKQAESAKQTAIFNAIIGTAQAIVAALAHYDYAGAILAGVLGAAQVAIIKSQKVPQYFKGTDNAPAGIAWVDEKGPELHTDKDGRIKSTGNKGANLRRLEKGDKIYTAEKTRRLLSAQSSFESELGGILAGNKILPATGSTLTKQDVTDGMIAAIKTMPEGSTIEINESERGREIYLRKKGVRTRILDSEVRLKATKLP